MGITNLYPNLPGHLLEFKDGGSSLISQPILDGANSILILGTSMDGPVNEPVQVDQETVVKLFGSDIYDNGLPNGATLTKYVKQAFKNGFTDVRAMRVTGSSAKNEDIKVTVVEDGEEVELTTTPVVFYGAPAYEGTADSTLVGYSVASAKINGDIVNGVTIDDTGVIKVAKNKVPTGCTISVSLVKEGSDSKAVDIKIPSGTIQVTLAKTPIEGTITAYANGKRIGTPEASDKVVTISTDGLRVRDRITVSYVYKEAVDGIKTLLVQSIYGGSEYNFGKIKIESEAVDESDADLGNKVTITITKPEAKKYTKNEEPMVFTSDEYMTFGDLAKAINEHPLNNVYKATTDYEEGMVEKVAAVSEKAFEGGSDGIKVSKSDLFEALSGKRDDKNNLIQQGAYQILENYKVDYIYPAGVYADDKVSRSKDFLYELALLCAVLTYRTKMTHGLMDMKPNTDTTLKGIAEHVQKALRFDPTRLMIDERGDIIYDSKGNPFDIGKYTTVCFGPEQIMISDTLGQYYGSPAIAYAGLNANINPWSAPTNKALIGTVGLRYKLSNKQMNDILGQRLVVFQLKNETANTTTPYVLDGCTCAKPGSDFARITTIKILSDVTEQIREVSDPFIGEPNTIEQRNALAAQISKRLTYLKEKGEILFYDFSIDSSIEQQLVGEASIALTIVCPQDLRKITTLVALKAAI